MGKKEKTKRKPEKGWLNREKAKGEGEKKQIDFFF